MPPTIKPPIRARHATYATHNINLPAGCFEARGADGNADPLGESAQFAVISSDRKTWSWFADEASAEGHARTLNAEAHAKQVQSDKDFAEACEAYEAYIKSLAGG